LLFYAVYTSYASGTAVAVLVTNDHLGHSALNKLNDKN